jgi:RNA polymerase sigma-70 factor (ECF subfamily)
MQGRFACRPQVTPPQVTVGDGVETDRSSPEAQLCEARSRVLAIMAKRLGNHELAEEAVQSALAECLRNVRAGGSDLRNPGGMLYTVARRRSADLLRLWRRERERLVDVDRIDEQRPPAPQESDRLVNRERVRAIMEFLPRLREDERKVLRLRFLEERPLQEVAERLELDPAQVSRLQWRALDRLRRMLDEMEK